MALNFRKTWLAGWLLVLLTAAPAWSQGLEDAQLFAPAEMDKFGGGPRPNEGFFASIDYLRWTIQAPNKTEIGFQGGSREVWRDMETKTIQTNTIDNGALSADWTDGQRIEFGYVSEHHGWFFSGFRLNTQDQRDMYSSVDMVFQDLEYGDPAQRHLYGYVSTFLGYDPIPSYEVGPDGKFVLHNLPLTFDTVEMHNQVKTSGVELNYLYRCHPLQCGTFEFFMGARYFEFKETFDVDARGYRFEYDSRGSVEGARSILADSNWSMDANNYVVGPQLGARFFKQSGRLTFSSEGRFLAGTNFQSLRQRGTLGSKLNDPWGNDPGHNNSNYWVAPTYGYPWVPGAMRATSFNHSEHEDEWAPGIELRLELKYQLTRALTARFGWDIFWIDGIARSSDLIDYTLAENKVFGIKTENNRQDVLMQGFNVGIELNR